MGLHPLIGGSTGHGYSLFRFSWLGLFLAKTTFLSSGISATVEYLRLMEPYFLVNVKPFSRDL